MMNPNANVSVCFVGKKEEKTDFDMSIKAILLTLQLNMISFIGL
jgi:hypothetical protein